MRQGLAEVTNKRVRIRYSVELRFSVANRSDFLLNVHAAQTLQQNVVQENFTVTPKDETELSINTDVASANRIAAFAITSGDVTARYEAVVDIAHWFAEPTSVVAETPSALPVATLRFLYPSRYCQSDLVQQQAWDLFGGYPRGYGQLAAVQAHVRQSLTFRVGTSHVQTSVMDTLREGCGVCRDFAHTMIAYCRALNYPTRFVTGIDYGADPALGPTDFHAYVEVFVGDRWYLFEPTGISPITGLVRIGTGRDAADVSFATIFGPVRTTMPLVEVSAVDDLLNGLVLPVHTGLAVSTAARP